MGIAARVVAAARAMELRLGSEERQLFTLAGPIGKASFPILLLDLPTGAARVKK